MENKQYMRGDRQSLRAVSHRPCVPVRIGHQLRRELVAVAAELPRDDVRHDSCWVRGFRRRPAELHDHREHTSSARCSTTGRRRSRNVESMQSNCQDRVERLVRDEAHPWPYYVGPNDRSRCGQYDIPLGRPPRAHSCTTSTRARCRRSLYVRAEPVQRHARLRRQRGRRLAQVGDRSHPCRPNYAAGQTPRSSSLRRVHAAAKRVDRAVGEARLRVRRAINHYSFLPPSSR